MAGKNKIKVRKFEVNDVVRTFAPVEKDCFDQEEYVFLPRHELLVTGVNEAGIRAVRLDKKNKDQDVQDAYTAVFKSDEIELVGKLSVSKASSNFETSCLTVKDRPSIVREAKNKAKSDLGYGALFIFSGLSGLSVFLLSMFDVIPRSVYEEVTGVIGFLGCSILLAIGGAILLVHGLITMFQED